MKQKLWFAALSLVLALRAEDPQGPITLQDAEIQEILSGTESYAYFGPVVGSSLSEDLPIIHHAAGNRSGEQKNLDVVCSLIAGGRTTAPSEVLRKALEEAVGCLSTSQELSQAEVEKFATRIETYYNQLEEGSVVLTVDNAITVESNTGAEDAASTRSTLKNRVFVGNVNIFGDNNVRGSENVSGNVTIRGNETVLSNLTVGGNTSIAGTLTINGVTINPTSINNVVAGSILNGGQSGPLTIGTTNATPLTFITNNVNRLQIDQTGNTTVSMNLRLPQATPNVSTSSGSALTSGLLDLGIGGGAGTKVSLFDLGSRNLFAGNYAVTPNASPTAMDNIAIGTNALQSITTGTGNVAIGPFASTALSVANNTVAIGVSANAQTSTDSVVIGNSATAAGSPRSVVLGSRDSTSSGAAPHTGTNGIAIGSASGALAGANASGLAAIAIGGSDGLTGTGGALANAGGSIALGVYSQAFGVRSMSLGNSASSSATDAIAIGTGAKAIGASSLALGSSTTLGNSPASSSGLRSLAIGSGSSASATDSLALGTNCIASANNTVAIGTDPLASSAGSISIGSNGSGANNSASLASGTSAIAIGSGGTTGIGANATSTAAISIGAGNGTAQGAVSSGTASTAIGASDGTFRGATAAGTRALAIGTASTSGATDSVALGSETIASGNNTIALGHAAQALTANGAIAIGGNNTLADATAPISSGASAIAIGSGGSAAGLVGAIASGTASIAIGGGDGTYTGATASGTRSVAIGTGASVSQNDAIILGNSTNAAVRVGIGTNAPTSRLQVAGAPGTPVATFNSGDNTAPSQIVFTNVQASGTAANGLQLSAAGSGNLQYFSSTRKIKQNIRAMRDESEVLYKLQPVVYDSKPGHGEGKDIPGFIAEEVYNVAPGLALLDQNGEPANVAYPYFHSLTVKELQKHQHDILQLKEEVAHLKTAMHILRNAH